MAEYEDALKIFNETVANLNQAADLQQMQAISEINAIQAQSMDPSDMGAYNLTMYGMNQVSDARSHVVNTVGNVNNYNLDPTPAATSMAYSVEHTSISSSLTSWVPGASDGGIFSHFVLDPTSILPTHHPSLWLVYGAFGLLLGKFLILRR